MPDEQSNLNRPAARRPNNRRRGRRGGRGRARAPQAPSENEIVSESTETSPPPKIMEAAEENPAPVENKTENAVPPNAPETPAVEKPVAVAKPAAPVRPARPEPLRPKPWGKPADFRPAETSAIHQAVAHATEIAESLKEMIDKIDEVLELVEVAERQKLADEREVDELRRALRRIQPPRQSHSQEREHGHGRGQSRSRSDGPRGRSESSRQNEAPAETPAESDDIQEPESTDQEPPSES